MFRTLFGWRASSIRADLKDVLDAMTPGESGFSPEESRMLKNILGLRERRVGDVMIPRADIIDVQQDIKLGELMRTFERAGHSRLVVYNDTLDDPVGMVHIRDLIAFMTARAAVDPEKNAKRKKPLPAGLDLKDDRSRHAAVGGQDRARDPVRAAVDAGDRPARAHAGDAHSSGAGDRRIRRHRRARSRSRTSSSRSSARSPTSTTRTNCRRWCARPTAPTSPTRARTLEDVVAIVGSDFDVGDAAEEVDTLGGYLVTRAGRLPLRGEIIPGPGLFEFEVLDADPRRVKRIRITRLKERREQARASRASAASPTRCSPAPRRRRLRIDETAAPERRRPRLPPALPPARTRP